MQTSEEVDSFLVSREHDLHFASDDAIHSVESVSDEFRAEELGVVCPE
jgi:hypothetical protein